MTTTPECCVADGACRGPLHNVHGDHWCTEHLGGFALDSIHHWAAVLHALSGSTPTADVAHILNVEPAR